MDMIVHMIYIPIVHCKEKSYKSLVEFDSDADDGDKGTESTVPALVNSAN